MKLPQQLLDEIWRLDALDTFRRWEEEDPI